MPLPARASPSPKLVDGLGFWLLVASALVTAGASRAAPCTGVDRRISAGRRAADTPAIERQLALGRARILSVMRFGGWSVQYVEVARADEAFVFYRGPPASTHYVTLWSGAARVDEEREIFDWAVENAPGIPPPLAACFAWMTINRK